MGFEKILIDLLSYLKEENFLVSEDVTADILSAVVDCEIDITNETELMNTIRSLVCKTQEQYLLFPELFHSFFLHIKKEAEESEKNKKKIKQTQERISKLQKRASEMKNKNGEKGNEKISGEFFSGDNQKKRDAFLKKTEKNKKKIESLLKSEKLSKEANDVARLLFFNEECEKYDNSLLEQILSSLQAMIKKQAFKIAMAGDKAMIDVLKSAMDMLEKGKEKIEKEKSRVKNKQTEEQILQSEINKLLKDLDELNGKITEKDNAFNHREAFVKAKNAVKSKSKGSLDLNKSIQSLNDKDTKLLQYYIEKNAKRFKTKIARNIKTESKLKFDMKNIVKKACATDGVPLRLIYKKPLQSKPKLVLILDISGSCSSASKLMLMFMYYLKQVFTGGCDAYVFVNSLHNITDVLNSNSPNEAINTVLKTIPVRGVYSDYYTPLKTFYEKKIHSITKDSIVVFIGDARNNSNPTGEEYIKAINRKARACFWLNTEPEIKWNVNDSIIGVYAKYMQETLPIITVEQLINFVTNFKIRR